MIGTLLNSINPRRAPQRPTNIPDSQIEDAHTRSLLFPDSNTLLHPDKLPQPLAIGSSGGSPFSLFDGLQSEADLDPAKDIRIIIGQDESAYTFKEVLFDSKPPTPRAESPTIPSGKGKSSFAAGCATAGPPTPQHSRRSSLFADPAPPRSPGAFHRVKSRGNSISSLPNLDQITAGRAKETDELPKTCLDCMFGNTPMSYRGVANKVHIVPLEPKSLDGSGPVAIGDRSPNPRSDGRKPSQLSRSFIPSEPKRSGAAIESASKDRRRTILVSRTFSVTLPDEQAPVSSEGTNDTPMEEDDKTPLASVPSSSSISQRRSSRRLPMFGVTVIINMPISSQRPASRNGGLSQRLAPHPIGSLHGFDSLASSMDSEPKMSWSWVDSQPGFDQWLANSNTSDVDDKVDLIGKHWNVIVRTLTALQVVVQEKIVEALRAMDAAAGLHNSGFNGPFSPMRKSMFKGPGNHKSDLFWLANDPALIKASNVAAERITRGMQICRVKLGQGRWGVWREEARWLGRWANSREQNFFFFTLLTAFLGHHTEWIKLVADEKHKKLQRQQQKAKSVEDFTVSHRTIIISNDKMAARRLIFLLSSFIPGSHQAMYDAASPLRPGTSASARGYSQSPPAHQPITRQHSLRRTINRRGRASHSSMRLVNTSKIVGMSDFDNFNDKLDFPSQDLAEGIHHTRRPSEARSIQMTLAIPPIADVKNTGRSSTATTSTVTPDSALPVPHFAIKRSSSSSAANDARPESSESAASANLINNLNRVASDHASRPSTDSSGSGRWGSFMSFWSGGRQESGTDHSEVIPNMDEGLGIAGVAYRQPLDKQSSKLEQMVSELNLNRTTDEPAGSAMLANPASLSLDEAYAPGGVPCSAAINIPPRPKQGDGDLKLSVDENGVIDVEIPGFGSPNGSPMLVHDASHSSLDASSVGQSSIFSLTPGETDHPISVAGYLDRKVHPDFALQGVHPYPELEKDIRDAMSKEPTPESAIASASLESGIVQKWVDVSTTLVADTRTFTVKRIRHRRLVQLIPNANQPVITPGILPMKSKYGNPYVQEQLPPMATASEIWMDDRYDEEPVVDMDPVLTDAVERVLLPSGNSSRAPSTASSRSSSRRGRMEGRASSDVQRLPPDEPPALQIPRGECKQILFEALEDVYRGTVYEHSSEVDKDQGSHTDTDSNITEKPVPRQHDSTLKEGVRKWLCDMEDPQSHLHQHLVSAH